MHSVGETYAHVKQAILDFHQRTVLNSQDFRIVNQPLSAFGNQDTPSRHTSQEKYPHIECWKCGRKGHYARNCRSDGVSPARSGASGSSGRSKGHRKGTNSGSPDHRKGSGKDGKEEKSKGKGKKGDKDKGKGKKGKGKAGVRAAEHQESSLGDEGLESEVYEAEASEEVWSEAGDLTELRLSMFVRSQSNHEELLVRPESNEESRNACCEQVGSRDACFVEQLESVIHEAPRLESVGASFGPSEPQQRAETSCFRRKSWASLASEEEKEVGRVGGQGPQHVQPIELPQVEGQRSGQRPRQVQPIVPHRSGLRTEGTRSRTEGTRSELGDRSQLDFGKLVSRRSPIFWTARPNGHLEKLCQPWRVEGRQRESPCDGCGVVAPVQPFSSHASSASKKKSQNAVARTSSLLFCSSCRSFGNSHVQSLRELRKALHKSKKGFLLEPSLVHGGFEQELSTFRKQNLRSSTVADLVMHPASGWNPFDRHRERAPMAPSEVLELGEIGDLDNLDDEESVATHELELNSFECLEQELHPSKNFESEFKASLVNRVEQESQEVDAVVFVASLGIREVVSKWSPGFAAWCTSCGEKLNLVELKLTSLSLLACW